MKATLKFLSLLFTVLILSNTAYAESPREQLKQMVGQLQANPNNDALRENIIRLARQLKPAPVIPEEAERRMVRGTAAFKVAKSVADYRNATKEFNLATLAAPWYGDAYLNLGVTQDKAESYDTALRSLKLALLASPNDKEIKTLIYEVEYRNEQAHSPEVEAARQATVQREKDEALIKGLDGAVFVGPKPGPWNSSISDFTTIYELRFHGNQVDLHCTVVEQGSSRWSPGANLPSMSASFTGRHFTIQNWSFDISPDGLSVSSDFGNPNMTFRKR